MRRRQKPEPIENLTFGQALRRYFISGIAVLLPLFITFYILAFVVQFAEDVIGKYFNQFLFNNFGFKIPGLGIILILLAIFGAGYSSRFLIGRKVLPAIDWILRQVPVLSQIYKPSKQFTDLVFASEGKKHFNRVVIVPYPNPEIYTIGFVTNEEIKKLDEHVDKELISVLVPYVPTPFTGILLYYPKEKVIECDIPVDIAIKTVLSGGVISPYGDEKGQ